MYFLQVLVRWRFIFKLSWIIIVNCFFTGD
jgi:hypothetical protein